MKPDVLVIGGGLSGLACALRLQERGVSAQILEATDRPGGRVKTDLVEGFLLDRGFQVLLTAYPETRRWLDYDALRLQPFFPGARVRARQGWHLVADPFREPIAGVRGAFTPIGTLPDKLRVARLRTGLVRKTVEEIFASPEQTTLAALQAHGFSDSMIDRFFRPFFGGVFLDRELRTSSRLFEFVFKMFSEGDIAVPAAGMEELPRQLAKRLEKSAIRTFAPVERVTSGRVRLASGEELSARAVVVATEGPAAARLLGHDVKPAGERGVTCVYFDAPLAPDHLPMLLLNGEASGRVNNVAVLSNVAQTYAPEGRALVSVSVLGVPKVDDEALAQDVRRELRDWFGGQVDAWKHLKTYRIPHAQPAMDPPLEQRASRLSDGLFVCGDHRETASLHGALVSGRRAADDVGDALGARR